jgi:hypothetical protein
VAAGSLTDVDAAASEGRLIATLAIAARAIRKRRVRAPMSVGVVMAAVLMP